jgi:hypothetical protein
MSNKSCLIQQRKKVELAQQQLNRIVKKEQSQLKKQLRCLKRDIKQSDAAVLTKSSIEKMMHKEHKIAGKKMNNNRMLAYFSILLSTIGFLYLNNQKKDN